MLTPRVKDCWDLLKMQDLRDKTWLCQHFNSCCLTCSELSSTCYFFSVQHVPHANDVKFSKDKIRVLWQTNLKSIHESGCDWKKWLSKTRSKNWTFYRIYHFISVFGFCWDLLFNVILSFFLPKHSVDKMFDFYQWWNTTINLSSNRKR